MGHLLYLLHKGSILKGYHNHLYDSNIFTRFFNIFKDTSIESTSQTLSKQVPVRWEECPDLVHPYGDRRQCHYETVWHFDVDNDVLFFFKSQSAGRLPLDTLRQRLVSFDDFEPSDVPRAPVLDLTRDFPEPYWKPAFQISKRYERLVRRLLDDFNHQWRHLLRGQYSDGTFRLLLSAVLWLVTLKFTVLELKKFQKGIGGPLIGPLDLPPWKPLPNTIIRIGRVWVISAQNLADCIPLIWKHQEAQRDHLTFYRRDAEYLVLSMRHVICCHVRDHHLKWTRPEPLFDGKTPLSEQAVEILLYAMSPTMQLRNSLQRLPVEIQDRILLYVSQGGVEAAKIGCVLGLGSPFSWRDGQNQIEREEVHRTRSSFSPVESQIWFGRHMSGISYKATLNTDS